MAGVGHWWGKTVGRKAREVRKECRPCQDVPGSVDFTLSEVGEQGTVTASWPEWLDLTQVLKGLSGCCNEKSLQKAKGRSHALCSTAIERIAAWFLVAAVEVGRGNQILDILWSYSQLDWLPDWMWGLWEGEKKRITPRLWHEQLLGWAAIIWEVEGYGSRPGVEDWGLLLDTWHMRCLIRISGGDVE